MRLLRDRRRKVERALQVVAEIQIVLPRPELELFVDGNAADRLDDFLLRNLPELLLLCGVRLDARGADLVVRDIAMRKVRHRLGRADDRSRIVELREIDV